MPLVGMCRCAFPAFVHMGDDCIVCPHELRAQQSSMTRRTLLTGHVTGEKSSPVRVATQEETASFAMLAGNQCWSTTCKLHSEQPEVR